MSIRRSECIPFSRWRKGTFRFIGPRRGVLLAVTSGVSEREVNELFSRGAAVKKVSRRQVTETWFPVPEAAARLKVSRAQVYALVKVGKLSAAAIEWQESKFRVKWITARSLERYAASRYVDPPGSSSRL